MALTVFWTDFAKSELRGIFDYYKQKAGIKIAHKLVESIVKETEKLCCQPLIGQKEELLGDRLEGFRYLVCKNHKIIYWVNNNKDRIEIADIFDTRQDPSKIINRQE